MKWLLLFCLAAAPARAEDARRAAALGEAAAEQAASLIGGPVQPVRAAAITPAALPDVHEAIQAALLIVGRLHLMDNSRTYTLSARGKLASGVPDDFLRTRTPQEILDSGLATGCGDFAAAFYSLISSKGFQALYIDGAELSWRGLLTYDAGHTGVAVHDASTGRWILVDPTFQKILSEDWDIHSKIYANEFAHEWIGYLGPLEEYTVRDHPGLMEFMKRTLASASKSVLESELMRFDFVIDDSLRRPEGGYVNPNVDKFLAIPGQLQERFGLNAARHVRVTLTDGGDDHKDRCRVEGDTARCSISRSSAMSLHLFLHIQGCFLEGCFHSDQVP